MTVNVGLYARVSTQEQTLENQWIILDKYIAQHPDYNVVDRYSDKASGSKQNRPGLDRMMADARAGKLDLIIATKLDRMARSLLNLKKICIELEERGIGLKFAEQPSIDTTTPVGRFMNDILGAVAELELEMIHERTMDGLARARKEGKTLGRPSTVLSDYQINKAKEILIANPDISQRQFADQFIGISRKQLIRELRTLGIWTK